VPASDSLSRRPRAQDADASDAHHFVSSVCWSRSGHTLVAANSLGTVKLLQLA